MTSPEYPRSRPCSVPGCAFGAPHAGAHGHPQIPATAYCAPARCYCGDCPSWVPRVPPPPPVLAPAELVAAVAELRAELAELAPAGRTPAELRAIAERRARARRADGWATAACAGLAA